tara:strand:- start:1233 stop:2132 length:900 start_codon:yes stop_codon:yes gene_type:complete
MSVYLGNRGLIQLKRMGQADSSGPLSTTVTANDVMADKKLILLDRLSTDEKPTEFITGDRIELTSTNDTTNLTFIDSYSKKSWEGFIHVDEMGNARLYDTFAKAITGDTSNAVALNASYSTSIAVTIAITSTDPRTLGQVTSYEVNTNRDTVDVTSLSDEFRQQYSTLISGSGRITTFWDYIDTKNSGNDESSQYLHQLILRTQIGCAFGAHFYLKVDGYNPSGGATTSGDVVYYDVVGVLTGTAIAFDIANAVKMTADFVLTGPIKLKVMTTAEYKLLTEGSDIFVTDDTSAKILLDG